MRDFILTQYKIHKSGGKSIGIERIKSLATVFLTASEQEELWSDKPTSQPYEEV